MLKVEARVGRHCVGKHGLLELVLPASSCIANFAYSSNDLAGMKTFYTALKPKCYNRTKHVILITHPHPRSLSCARWRSCARGIVVDCAPPEAPTFRVDETHVYGAHLEPCTLRIVRPETKPRQMTNVPHKHLYARSWVLSVEGKGSYDVKERENHIPQGYVAEFCVG